VRSNPKPPKKKRRCNTIKFVVCIDFTELISALVIAAFYDLSTVLDTVLCRVVKLQGVGLMVGLIFSHLFAHQIVPEAVNRGISVILIAAV
jgi:hypothetical protein